MALRARGRGGLLRGTVWLSFSIAASSFSTCTMSSSSAFPSLTCIGSALSADTSGRGLGYVDVHAHIIHPKFAGKEDAVALDCIAHQMDHVIINGLEPESNRQILEYCEKYSPYMLPAAGIYPLDAACNKIYTQEDVDRLAAAGVDPLPAVNWSNEFPPPTKFDVDAEIDFIEELCKQRKIVAIGECGLDKHYLTDTESFSEQERVLRKLMQLGKLYDLPLIVHSRKAEQRLFDMLVEEGVKKVDFHCFGGKVKLAQKIAEAGFYLSIPSAVANADANSSFKKLVQALPVDRILTETDSPYMGPVKGEDNTPVTVLQSIETFARIKGVSVEEMREQVRSNFRTLFGL